MNEVFGDVAGEVEAERAGRSASCLAKEELPEEEIHQNQTILEEVFTPDYNVTEEEVLEYCSVLGIDVEREPYLVPLARTALLQPLPKPWAPVKDPRVGVYSSWAHPVDEIARALIAKERAKGAAAHAAAGAGPASAALCNAHANAAGRGSCTDSCIEDLVTDEDVLVSEFLREASQADHAPSSPSSSDAGAAPSPAAPPSACVGGPLLGRPPWQRFGAERRRRHAQRGRPRGRQRGQRRQRDRRPEGRRGLSRSRRRPQRQPLARAREAHRRRAARHAGRQRQPRQRPWAGAPGPAAPRPRAAGGARAPG